MNELENFEDFSLLLFLHLASVDGSLHPNERDTILEKMKELFPENSSYEEKLLAMETRYRKLGSGVAEELITSTWQNFSSIDPSMKYKLYAGLFDIINSDSRVNEEETRFLKVLKTWLMP